MRLFPLLSLINIIYVHCSGYRPVVIVHGIMTGNLTLLHLASKIKWEHPDTKVYVPERFAGWSSLLPMWRQILELGEDIMNISYNHPEGINLIGYSQGGLIARGILEAFPDHNVKTFISLSAPQGGQYGTQFLHLFFKNMTKNTAYRLFYSKLGQHTSVGNYWRDPHHEKLYLKYSNFLPFVNNDETCPDTMYFKLGITNLKKLVLIGGPSDGVISPWQSSHFGYYDDDENVLELKDQISFQNDVLGLKTLNDSNRLEIISVDGVTHFDWHCNDSVIDNYIIPYLD